MPEHAAVLAVLQGQPVVGLLVDAVVIEIVLGERGIEPVSAREGCAHRQDGGLQIRHIAVDGIREPCRRQDIGIDEAAGAHVERAVLVEQAQARPLAPPFVRDVQLALDVQQVALALRLDPAVLGRQVLAQGLMVYQARLDHEQDGRHVHPGGVLRHPVVFPKVRWIRDVGGEGHAAVEHGPGVLRISAHGLQQVRDLLLFEILRLVPEHVDVATARQRGRPVERSEGQVHARVEDHRPVVGEDPVPRLPKALAQPGLQVGRLHIPEYGRLALDNVVDALLEAFPLQGLQHRRDHVRREVCERVGHPGARGAGHVLHHVQHPLGETVRRLGRAAAQLAVEILRRHQLLDLQELIHVLNARRLRDVSVDLPPVTHARAFFQYPYR